MPPKAVRQAQNPAGATVTDRRKNDAVVDPKEEERANLAALMKAEKLERFDIPGWAKEVSMYLIFLFFFTFLVFASRSNVQIVTYQDHWLRILEAQTKDIRTAAHVDRFLADGLVQDLLGEDYFADDAYSNPGVGAYAYGSAIIGGIYLRQVRVQPAVCGSAHDTLQERGLMDAVECHPHFAEGKEDTLYTKQQAVVPPAVGTVPFFTYTPASETGAAEKEGQMAVYPGGGYVVDLTASNAQDQIQLIQETSWLDPKTRALFIDFVAFSPQTDMFCLVRLLFEYTPGGVVYTERSARAVFLDRYPLRSDSDRLVIALELLVYGMVMFYLVEEIREMRAVGRGYWKSGWNAVDWVNLLLFLVVGGEKIVNIRRFNSLFVESTALIDPRTISQQIEELGNSLLLTDQLNGVNGFILWFKLFKYLSITRRMVRLSKTVVRTTYDVLSFCVLFFVIAYAFVVFGHLLFKSKVRDYQTALQTSVTLLRGVYGDIDLSELIDSVGTWGFLYFLFWLVVSRTLLLNVIIAILMGAYRAVLDKEKEVANKTTFERIQDELKIQRIESGGDAMFFRISRLLESNISLSRNPQEEGDHNEQVKKRLGWDRRENAWTPYGAQQREPDTPLETPREAKR